MSLHAKVRNQLIDGLSQTGENEISQLNNALRLLAKHRSLLIQNTLIKNNGLTVLQGPLSGLKFIEQSAEGCHVAKLLGCYEQPLQKNIKTAIDSDYDVILNIGCAEGYYAVGMARHMQNTKTYAYDINENAQRCCAILADLNAVSDKVFIGGNFSIENFEKFKGKNTLVFCDIEGAEIELLDPDLAPSLLSLDIIVEAHEADYPGTVKLLMERFSKSHDIELIEDTGQRNLINMPEWFMKLSHLDQLLATWEWRSGPTPWLVMKKIN